MTQTSSTNTTKRPQKSSDKKGKPCMHFVPDYFLNPVHPIKICLIGAGGNGSQMLSALARINHALHAKGQPGITVTVYDHDKVEATNIGRQLFSTSELGSNKAETLVTRFNRIYGTAWEAVPKRFDTNTANRDKANIIISCVDNVKTRTEIGKYFRKQNITAAQYEKYRKNNRYGYMFYNYNEYYTFYWLDLGNGRRTGQAILGSNRIPQPDVDTYTTVPYLPTVAEQYKLSKVNETESGPSCSMAEALNKQDLFINSVLVQTAASLLWSLLTDIAIDTRGIFVNVDSYRTAPLVTSEKDIQLLPATIRKDYYRKCKTKPETNEDEDEE